LQQLARFLQRETDGLQHHDLLESDQVRIAVEPTAGARGPARLPQPEPIVVMQRAHGDARALRELMSLIALHWMPRRAGSALTLRQGQEEVWARSQSAGATYFSSAFTFSGGRPI